MPLPVVLRPNVRRVLMIGLGGATVPARYYDDYPQMRIDVAELDPAVVDAARRYFHAPAGSRLRVATEDGRLFVTRSPIAMTSSCSMPTLSTPSPSTSPRASF